MRQSLLSIAFAAALLFECYLALPMGQTGDGPLEQDAFDPLPSDEGMEYSLANVDLTATGRTRGPRVIVVADPSMWREMRLLQNRLSLYKRRADDNGQAVEHTDALQDKSIPILRRDMRCMVGRVYRPCWEV